MSEPKKKHTRNTERVLISLYPEDLKKLDRIAANLAEPGGEPNRSHAVRTLIRDAKKYLRSLNLA